MASNDLKRLPVEFQEKIDQLINNLSFPILIYCTGRSAEEQAKLWRQNRSIEVIEKKKGILEKYGHHELAKILIDVGPQYGPHVTHSGPGESWLQYYKAFEAVPFVNGMPVWNYNKNKEIWQELGREATNLGINWAGNWLKWCDYSHFQIETSSNPLKLGLTNCIMREKDL